MPAIRLELCGETEIVVPADKFKSSAEFDEAEELLWKEDFRGDPSFDDDVLAVIIDGKGQTLVIGLRHRVEQFGTVACVYSHTAFLPRPASLVVVENAKPDKAVQQVEAARREQAGDAIEVIEEFAVGPDVERTEQHIGEVERTETAVEVAHVADDKRGLDAIAPRLVAGEFDHGGAQIEPAIGVAPLVPFLEIGRRAGAELKNLTNSGRGEFVDCGFEKIDLADDLAGG